MDTTANDSPPLPQSLAESTTAATIDASNVTPPSEPNQKGSFMKLILLAIAMLGIGAAATFFALPLINPSSSTSEKKDESHKIVLPSNAVQIQECANNKGALYVEPQNIPVGPVYLVHNGEVIGIEYMLSKDEILSGKTYKHLNGLGIKVDHINIGVMEEGHEVYESPHYHIDVYSVSEEVESKIICPHAPTPHSMHDATESAKPSPSTTPVLMQHDEHSSEMEM